MKKEEGEKKIDLYFDKKNIAYPTEKIFLYYEKETNPVFLCKWNNKKYVTYVVTEKGILPLPK